MKSSEEYNKYKVIILSIILVIMLIAAIILAQYSTYNKKIQYEDKIFDDSYVHTVDLEVKDFDEMIENCLLELYYPCNITIDGEEFRDVGIRAKGNNSMTEVITSGTNRHSFKIEFDQYDDSKSYYGLDKLVLNNIIFDNTYIKEYLVYKFMRDMGADAPLCSYSFININGEPWGLYMSIESIEDGLIERLYGSQHGKLYKPETPEWNELEEFQDSKGYTIFPEDFDWNTPDVRLQYIDYKISSYPCIFSELREKTLNSNSDRYRLINSLHKLNKQKDLEDILDIENLIPYFVVHNYIYNDDSYTGSIVHNYYLYEYNGKLNILPWDYSLGFGCYNVKDKTEMINDPIDEPIEVGIEQGKHPMFTWITSDNTYKNKYHDTMQQFINYLTELNTDNFIDDTYNQLLPYIKQEKVKFCNLEETEQAILNLKLFMRLRTMSIEKQLNGELGITRLQQIGQEKYFIDAEDLDLKSMGYLSRGND